MTSIAAAGATVSATHSRARVITGGTRTLFMRSKILGLARARPATNRAVTRAAFTPSCESNRMAPASESPTRDRANAGTGRSAGHRKIRAAPERAVQGDGGFSARHGGEHQRAGSGSAVDRTRMGIEDDIGALD